MNFKKKAFTITEVLIVLCIMGFVLIVQLSVLMNKINDYGAPYYTAYNAINKAVYNVLADIHCPDSCTDDDCRESYPALRNITHNPAIHLCPDYAREFPTTRIELCKRLAEWLNHSEEFCDAHNVSINANADNINENSLQIITSNSFRVYISDPREYSKNGEKFNYFIVYMDLNGEKKPNRLTCDGSDVLPDIVPFAITSRGEVIPTGLPTYLKTYLTGSVRLPSTYDDGSMTTDNKTGALSFYEAIRGAWQGKANINIPYSIEFDSLFPISTGNITQCYRGGGSQFNKNDFINKAVQINSSLGFASKGCKGDTYTCNVKIDKFTTSRY
ncbi:hypothetical protein IJ425_06780 [bacterium]|nr:hypothetical protein [bacterium]